MFGMQPSFIILLITNSTFVLTTFFMNRSLTRENALLFMINVLFIIFFTNVLNRLIYQWIYKEIFNDKNKYYYLGNKNEIAYKILALFTSIILYLSSIFFNEIDLVFSLVVLSAFFIQKPSTILIENDNIFLTNESYNKKFLILQIAITNNNKVLVLYGEEKTEFIITLNKFNKEAINMFINENRRYEKLKVNN